RRGQGQALPHRLRRGDGRPARERPEEAGGEARRPHGGQRREPGRVRVRLGAQRGGAHRRPRGDGGAPREQAGAGGADLGRRRRAPAAGVSALAETIADLRERARYYATLTELGVPPRASAGAAAAPTAVAPEGPAGADFEAAAGLKAVRDDI